MTEAVAENKKEEVIVAPFCVEANHPRNDNLLIQSVPGLVLRSAFDGSKGIVDAKTGEHMVPVDQSRHLAAFPKTPGMKLHIDPARFTYFVEDPLNADEELCEKIQRFFNRNGNATKKVKGAPLKKESINMHNMKTLCREVFNLIKLGHVQVVQGAAPTMKDIDRLPGHYLLNPGSRVFNSQPRYEKDFESWISNLTHQGG